MDLEIAGRCAAVAASSSGLGFETARALAEEGARVALCSRDADRVSEAASKVGRGAIGLACDLSTREGARAFITGDCTHHPVQWAEPDWEMSADTDSAQAARTRRALIDAHGDAQTLIIGTHYAGPTAGHVVRGAEGWEFRALL